MVFLHRKGLIKKCNQLSLYYTEMSINFRHMALSIEKNKLSHSIRDFINNRYNELIKIKEKDI